MSLMSGTFFVFFFFFRLIECGNSFYWFLQCSEVRLEGLETMDYYDHLNNKTRATEYGDALIFEEQVSLFLHTSVFPP
jgi:hypothetical protein